MPYNVTTIATPIKFIMLENKKNGNRKLARSAHAPLWTPLLVFLLTQNLPSYCAKGEENVPDSLATSQIVESAKAIASTRTTVTYYEVDGQNLLAEFQRPANDEILPVILFVHGGAWVAGSRLHFMAHANQIISSGFAVFSIDYRLAPKYKFPAPLEDVREALKYVDTNAKLLKIDPSKIVIWGYSAGAQLAALASLQPVDGIPRPLMCVAGGTPSDLTQMPENSGALSAIFGGTRKQVPDIYRDASPITFVSSDDPPVFLYQGDQDWLVAKKFGDQFYDSLKSAKVPSEYYVCQGQGHIAAFLSNKPVTRALAFIHRTIDKPTADH